MDATRKILNGTLRPYLPDTKGDDYYGPEYNQLQMPLETFIPHYKIDFKAPQFTFKLKYYSKLIDAAVIEELNTLFHEYFNASDSRIVFKLMQIRRTTESRAEEIHKYITQNGYDIDALNSPGVNYKEDVQSKECAYIYNYLLQSLIRVYLEFQYHFRNQLPEAKTRSYDDFFIMKLGIPTPTVNRLVEIESPEKSVPAAKIVKNRPVGKKGFWIISSASKIGGTFLTNIWLSLEGKGFIQKGTSIHDFKECFNAKTIKQKIVWIEDKDLLTYFIKKLYNTGIIDDEGSKWVATCNCFTDKNGNAYDPTNLKDQKKPKKRTSDIDNIIQEAVDATMS